MVLERQIFLQKEGRYSEHILYCNTFDITQQKLRKLVSSSHWGGKVRVPHDPSTLSRRSIELTSIGLTFHQQLVNHAVARAKSG